MVEGWREDLDRYHKGERAALAHGSLEGSGDSGHCQRDVRADGGPNRRVRRWTGRAGAEPPGVPDGRRADH